MILIICNFEKRGTEELGKSISQFLSDRSYKSIMLSNEMLDNYSLNDDVRLAVVLGGDGTVLAAARKLAVLDIPILALNFGTIGFMTEVEKDCWQPALESFLDGTFVCRKHMMLDVSIIRNSKVIASSSVLNEGVLNSPDSKMLKLTVNVGDSKLGKYLSDGLIISTTTGSTAYSAAAGGPIVYPDLETVIITPICPYSYIVRPVVVTPDRAVSIYLEPKNESAILVLDGQTRIPLRTEDMVVFEKSDYKVRIITLPGSESRFYSKLNDRMCLGGARYDR